MGRTVPRPRRSNEPRARPEPSAARVGAHHVDVLLEVGDAQRAREPRRAAGRQHVVGSGHVVAEHRGRVRRRRTPRPRCARAGRAGRPPTHMSSRCSGAIALAASTARAASSTRITRPPASRVDSASSRRAAATSSASSASSTRSATASSQTISATAPPGPCSACARRSTATHAGRRCRRRRSRPRTRPRARRCRPSRRPGAWPPRRTRCPGPTMTSTGRSAPAPNAIAATACAPTDRVHLVDAGDRGGGEDRVVHADRSRSGGEHSTTSGTPATRGRERRHQHRRRERRAAARARSSRRDRRARRARSPRRRGARVAARARVAPRASATIWSRASSNAARSPGDRCARARRRSRPDRRADRRRRRRRGRAVSSRTATAPRARTSAMISATARRRRRGRRSAGARGRRGGRRKCRGRRYERAWERLIVPVGPRPAPTAYSAPRFGYGTLPAMSTTSDLAALSSIAAQVDELSRRITALAESYGADARLRGRQRAVLDRASFRHRAPIARPGDDAAHADARGLRTEN